MFAVTFVVLFLTGTALASPSANQYVDHVLHSALKHELKNFGLDPASLPDFQVEFEDKTLFVKVKGKAEFEKGKLTGLSDVKRLTECQGPYSKHGARNINCTIVFNNLKITYDDGKIKYGLAPKVNIKGKANVTSTTAFFEVSSFSPGTPGSVINFYFTRIGQFNSEFTGLGPLNRHVKFLENGFKSHVDAQIFNYLSLTYRQALDRAAGMIPVPN